MTGNILSLTAASAVFGLGAIVLLNLLALRSRIPVRASSDTSPPRSDRDLS